MLWGFLELLRPARVVEVGIGWSSTVMLDHRDVRGRDLALACIDPDVPAWLAPALAAASARVVAAPLWEVDVGVFRELERGDVLFIDSPHVAKLGGDVNDYLFRILPALRPGVVVHVHDVPHNLEIDRVWFDLHWYWNECEMLSAFLMYNAGFRVLYHSAWLAKHHPDAPGVRVVTDRKHRTFVKPWWKWTDSFWMQKEA